MERGGGGKFTDSEVQAYKQDVKNIMIRMGLLSGEEVHTVQQKNVTRAEYLEAETDGLWYPVFSAGDTFAGGAVLGTVRDIWGNLLREYRAPLKYANMAKTPTLKDIVKELEKPARDPREEMQKPILRTDVLDMKDLKPGMILKGTVRNVIDFGAFVDIGVHQDGLVHISQMSRKYIKHPLEAVSVGDIVEVKVLGVDMAKKRISLSMILDEE